MYSAAKQLSLYPTDLLELDTQSLTNESRSSGVALSSLTTHQGASTQFSCERQLTDRKDDIQVDALVVGTSALPARNGHSGGVPPDYRGAFDPWVDLGLVPARNVYKRSQEFLREAAQRVNVGQQALRDRTGPNGGPVSDCQGSSQTRGRELALPAFNCCHTAACRSLPLRTKPTRLRGVRPSRGCARDQ